MKSCATFLLGVVVVLLVIVLVLAGKITIPSFGSSPVASPTPPTPPSQLYDWATHQHVFLTDALTSQDDNNWFEGLDDHGATCTFRNGAYHAYSPKEDYLNFCPADANKDSNLSSFAFQVRMTVLKGDAGGLIFRDDQFPHPQKFYLFAICVNRVFCKGGNYILKLYQSNETLANDTSTAINPGNVTNVLTVITYDNHIYIYANTHFLAQVDDTTSSSGYIGMSAYKYTDDTDVAFNDVQVWQW